MKFKAIIAMAAACCMAFSCSSPVVLGGSDWVFDTACGEKVVTSEKTPFIRFDEAEGRVHGCLGVNIVNGSYTLDGKNLTFSQMASTMMAGLPSDMDVESKLGAALGTVASVEVKGETMSLKDAEGNVVLTLVKSETPVETEAVTSATPAAETAPADSVAAE